MNKKTFCPFINGHCVEECMFFTAGGSIEPDKISRHCIIAKTLVEFPGSERQEKAFYDILTALKSRPRERHP